MNYMIKNRKYVVLMVSFLAVFGLFGTTQAVTVSELQAQITQLLSQISQLQSQLTTLQGGQSNWCHTFNTNLKIGMSGTEVESLQEALAKEGLYIKGTDAATFNENIASAVVSFQQKYTSEILTPNKLKYGTGFVGVSTRAKLNILYGCKQVCAQVITPAKNSATNECKEFPTPCDVPTGWEKVNSCATFSEINDSSMIEIENLQANISDTLPDIDMDMMIDHIEDFFQ